MKKFISMALALMMTLSLCTFLAAPKAEAAFDDVDELSSKYAVQATEVIQTIEVMDGYDDNTFRPTAGLTRQAAAKIICNMILGPTTARALPTNANPFPDVIAGNQFSGYISYCSQQGIISGYADGTFRPGDPLSGYAYLKMLLGALGYDQNEEGFVGSNWKVNVAKIALGIGLNKGIDGELDGSTQVTREEAAIYAFNTLQADMVEYESKNTLEINGVKVTMGGSNAVPQTWNTSGTSIDNISASRSDGNNQRPIVQFAERYFDKLRREPNGYHPLLAGTNREYQSGRDEYATDDFGRPSIRWFWKGVEIGTYSRDPDATFVGNVKVNAIYEALRENTGMSSGDDNAYLYINSDTPNNMTLEVKRANDKDLDHVSNLNMNRIDGSPNKGNSTGPDGNHRVDRIGDGTLIEVFRNDANNHVDVCVISVYGGKVSSVRGATTKKNAYVTIDYANDGAHCPDNIGDPGNNEYETEDFDEDDVVAYTYSDSADSIKSMYLMSSESGALSSRVSEKSLTLDGVLYSYGKEYAFHEMTERDLSSKSSYVVYLDENDYVLWVEEDEFAVDQYVLLERITVETTANRITTKTASVIGTAEYNAYNDGVNDARYQMAFNQTKDPVGNSTWDAQAQVRLSNGTRRTVTLDDSKNYRTDTAGDSRARASVAQVFEDDGVTPKLDRKGNPLYTGNAALLTNNSGDGNGNWIADDFTAGRVVRMTSTSSGYKLHHLDEKYVFSVNNFRLNNKKVYNGTTEITTPRYQDANGNWNGGTRLLIDSETHFVVEDTDNGTYKSYVGSKNVPDIGYNTKSTDIVTAYIYHRGDLAKLIFITKADNVSTSSNDIIFLAANSRSNLVDSDDGYYYDVSAVDKNVIKTIRVKRNALLTMGDPTKVDANGKPTAVYFEPDAGGNDKEWKCVILNNVTYDSNDLLTDGYFDDTKISATRAHGIRRINDEEIRLDTFGNAGSYLRDISESAHIYFVDGSDIEQIEYDEIVNDTNDYVYYVEDDGVITYLFIVDYEPDTVQATYTLDTTVGVPAGYTISIVGGAPATVVSGDSLSFQVIRNSDGAAMVGGTNSGNVSVSLRCTDANSNVVNAVAAESDIAGLWTVNVPAGLLADSTVFFRVTVNP